MKYNTLSLAEQKQGYKTRIRQLEEEHFGNSLSIFEADIIGDAEAEKHFKELNADIEKRIAAINGLIDELNLSEFDTTNSEEQNGDTK